MQRITDRNALLERASFDMADPGVGVMSHADLAVTAGAGMQSNVAAGRCRIRSNYLGADHGIYELWSDAVEPVTHAAAGANPRIDQVLARVRDFTEQGGPDDGTIYIQAGVPTSGATLDNRTGVTTPDPMSVLLSDVLVPVGAGSAAAFTYRNRRPLAMMGHVPLRVTTNDQTYMIPFGTNELANFIPASFQNSQRWALMYLPRRVTAATRIRWLYKQSATTALSGQYNIGIYDASGRLIVATGAVSFAGIVSTFQARAETIASTTLEAGAYYVCFGFGALGGSTTGRAWMVTGTQAPGPNMSRISTTGGTALPTVMTSVVGIQDAYNFTSIGYQVPVIALATS